jgi:hypothetical protein
MMDETTNMEDYTLDGVLALTPNKMDTMGDVFITELFEEEVMVSQIFSLYSGMYLDEDRVDLTYNDPPEMHIGGYDLDIVYKCALNSGNSQVSKEEVEDRN